MIWGGLRGPLSTKALRVIEVKEYFWSHKDVICSPLWLSHMIRCSKIKCLKIMRIM